MSTLIDTANGVTMARKERDVALKALREQRDAESEGIYQATEEARIVAEDFERTYSLARTAIQTTYRQKVADLTGVDVEEVERSEGNCW